jgi:nucleoside-diphosphate-sugar epimerase
VNKNDQIVITGAGGFIAGALVKYFKDRGFSKIRAVDKKPLPEWYQRIPGVESLSIDLSDEQNCKRAVEGAVEVYNLAADMGGMGFIELYRVECLRSILINTHLIEASYRAGVDRYFFSSSACAYNTELPAAICRKVIQANDTGSGEIEIWGDGKQTRSFMYIDDCTEGIDRIMHCDRLIATPINLGSTQMVSINELVDIVERIAGSKLNRRYKADAPTGVAGRNSDNTFIKEVLAWEPETPLEQGMKTTYQWIAGQYADRKAGKRTVS